MDRPQEITRFALCAIVASLANACSTSLLKHFGTQVLIGAAIGVAIIVGLVLWVVRGRSAIGRVVATLWIGLATGAGAASYVFLIASHHLSNMPPAVQMLSGVTILANCIALYFLWTPASTAWLQRPKDAA